jgi:hypothetical protein
MEYENSLPCSKQPATRSYPEPDESSHTDALCNIMLICWLRGC